jgi:PAS domain S-box-containing protein
VLHEDNAVVFSFRDVTKERATAIELKQTKEFLESVIDSSVDGIVSANLRGTVLLFNRAAARIFGYSPSDVVGKMRVESLYPPGVARSVMRKIRDPNVSGYGRLEDHRVDMLTSSGEAIQVQISASLVIDNGRPIGSVGIFTDIRDKLRMEARLHTAQEELRSREKQAIVAELAGAAAHELNQPLTSVIGYAELLKRQLGDHQQLCHAANVIVIESERMAEIVRKVGKITKYETKSYVGAAKILDLEKATENEGGDQPR